LDRKLKFGRDEFAEFVRSRRSHRAYKDEKIPRADLEHLVQMARFCPTGGNAQPVQILIIEDEARLDKLSKLTQAAIQDLYPGAREKREKAGIEEREDPIFHKAPALMVFHIPKGRGSARTDSVIAAQTVVLAAMTIGLGTCYIGLLEHAWHTDETTREVLDLPEGHTLGSAIVLGYPALTFLRAVDRRPMDVRWE
ncbi:MAG: nitroreductase family protein, partial [Candidatus Hydrogenedentes bacterium]|nr:nitroreductase family protein [Candidatus Hydrogenedentota bacterium]